MDELRVGIVFCRILGVTNLVPFAEKGTIPFLVKIKGVASLDVPEEHTVPISFVAKFIGKNMDMPDGSYVAPTLSHPSSGGVYMGFDTELCLHLGLSDDDVQALSMMIAEFARVEAEDMLRSAGAKA